MTNNKYNPDEDGVTHINIFSKGKTELGRELSHFYKSPFKHPYFGFFTSMEGFWYFMRCAERPDKLRYLYGYIAKLEGRQFTPNWYPEFWEDIAAANYQKIIQNQSIQNALIKSELPFTHYYMFGKGNGPQFPVEARDADKLCGYIEEIRTALKNNLQPQCWINAEKRYVNSF